MKTKAPRRIPKSTLKNSNMLVSAFEQTADHVVITDIEGVILYVNPAFERTTGYAEKEAIGQTPRILKSGQYNKSFYKGLWDTILDGRTFQGTIANKKKNGELYYAYQTITPIQDKFGQITRFISIWKDVTGRIHAHQELDCLHENLKSEKQKLEKILNFGEEIETIHNFNMLADFIVEQASSILESERCSLMLLDEYKGELCIKGAVGLRPDIVKKSKLNIGEGVAGLVAKEGEPVLVKVIDDDKRFRRDSFSTYQTKSFLSVPIKFDHKLIGVLNVTDKKSKENPVYTEIDLKILLAVVRQVAIALENAQLSKELKYLTITDPLTALYNHRYLMECLAYEIRRFRRFNRPLCLLIIDVDDFKKYNDDFGSQEGDRLLRKISEILKETLREVDVICRYAGDEFVAILPETNEAETRRLAEMIRKSVKKAGLKSSVTLSMGVVKCSDRMSRHEFILKVRASLCKAKSDGKNRIHCQNISG